MIIQKNADIVSFRLLNVAFMSQWEMLLGELYYIGFVKVDSESDIQEWKVIKTITLKLDFITFVCNLVCLWFVILQEKHMLLASRKLQQLLSQ